MSELDPQRQPQEPQPTLGSINGHDEEIKSLLERAVQLSTGEVEEPYNAAGASTLGEGVERTIQILHELRIIDRQVAHEQELRNQEAAQWVEQQEKPSGERGQLLATLFEIFKQQGITASLMQRLLELPDEAPDQPQVSVYAAAGEESAAKDQAVGAEAEMGAATKGEGAAESRQAALSEAQIAFLLGPSSPVADEKVSQALQALAACGPSDPLARSQLLRCFGFKWNEGMNERIIRGPLAEARDAVNRALKQQGMRLEPTHGDSGVKGKATGFYVVPIAPKE